MLSVLLNSPSISSVYNIARRAPKTADQPSKLHNFIESDNSKWITHFSSIQPPPSIFLSGLGTTRAAAGSFENQRKIDYDLNLSLAKAAKEAGVKVYVLISSANESVDSRFGYSKMKGELEVAVKALDFDHTVLVKPGLIVGPREESRALESAARGLAKFLGAVSHGYLKDSWAQDADVIGKAAVSAGLNALNGKAPGDGKVWELYAADIIKLGKTEWTDGA